MQQCTKFYYFIFIWSSTCFGRHTAHHQEPKTALAASGFPYVEGWWTCSWWALSGTLCCLANPCVKSESGSEVTELCTVFCVSLQWSYRTMHSVLCVLEVKWQNYAWCSVMSLQWSDRTMHSVLGVPVVKWQNYAQYSVCPCSEVTELCTVFCVSLQWSDRAMHGVLLRPCSEVTELCTVFCVSLQWSDRTMHSILCPCSEVTELCTVFCGSLQWSDRTMHGVLLCPCSKVTELCTVFCVSL